MFDQEKNYLRAKESGVITKSMISRLYGIETRNILLIEYDEGFAFKITFPRPIVQGNIGDGDQYGGQLSGPLMNIEVPGP